MQKLNDQLTFTHIQLLHTSNRNQIVRCNYKKGRKVNSCVLKLFPTKFRLSFEQERETYNKLLDANTNLLYPLPLGYTKWSVAKYEEVIGSTIGSILDGTPSNDSGVYVLMLHFIENAKQLDKVYPSLQLAIEIIASLDNLHRIRIVHGDLSLSNILLIKESLTDVGKIMFLDFASSWTNASRKQLEWETKNAVEFFAAWVHNSPSTPYPSLLPKVNIFKLTC